MKNQQGQSEVLLSLKLKRNPYRIVGIEIVRDDELVYMKTEKQIVEEIDPKVFRNKDRYSNGSLVLDVSETGEVVETWTKKRIE